MCTTFSLLISNGNSINHLLKHLQAFRDVERSSRGLKNNTGWQNKPKNIPALLQNTKSGKKLWTVSVIFEKLSSSSI